MITDRFNKFPRRFHWFQGRGFPRGGTFCRWPVAVWLVVVMSGGATSWGPGLRAAEESLREQGLPEDDAQSLADEVDGDQIDQNLRDRGMD